jgi:hypothetical protein
MNDVQPDQLPADADRPVQRRLVVPGANGARRDGWKSLGTKDRRSPGSAASKTSSTLLREVLVERTPEWDRHKGRAA